MTNRSDTKDTNPNAKPAYDALTIDDIDRDLRERIHVIRKEFIEGLNFIRQHKRTVTFFGSARFLEDNPHYQKAREVANLVAESGADVVTGGGGGIMEAANRGASEAEGEDAGHSLGINIELPMEQTLNEYVEDSKDFHYFFSRKVALTFSAEAYLVFPGGFGTMDEFFEIITLMQTNKIVQTPVLLVGSSFWNQWQELIENTLANEFQTISPEDMDLYEITDDVGRIVEVVENAPLREE